MNTLYNPICIIFVSLIEISLVAIYFVKSREQMETSRYLKAKQYSVCRVNF